MVVIVVKDKGEVVEKLCELIEVTANESIQSCGRFLVGFSGGSLASFLVEGLPKIKTDFSSWTIFFCDERVVPENDPNSTFGLYKTTMIDSGAVNLRPEQFITIKQGVSPEEAAEDYTRKIGKFFPNSIPSFDMLLLGMGPDGHTCSLFPGHALLKEQTKIIAAITDSPKPPPCRITMTMPVVNNAKKCIFACSGKEKADMIKRILVDKEDLPAGRVNPKDGQVVWILDAEAGKYDYHVLVNNAKKCIFTCSGKDKMIKRIFVDKKDLPFGRVNLKDCQVVCILDAEAGKYIH